MGTEQTDYWYKSEELTFHLATSLKIGFIFSGKKQNKPKSVLLSQPLYTISNIQLKITRNLKEQERECTICGINLTGTNSSNNSDIATSIKRL